MSPFIINNSKLFLNALAKYSINTPLRVAHFFGQMHIETGNFTASVEDISYDKAQENYQNHRWLGNKLPGDGYRFRGRGITQLTGRYNYDQYKKYSGLDVINNPDLVQRVDVSIDVACWYWSVYKKINQFADNDDHFKVSAKINGVDKNGLPKHYAERKASVEKYKKLDILALLKKKIKLPNPFARINKYGLWNSFVQAIKK